MSRKEISYTLLECDRCGANHKQSLEVQFNNWMDIHTHTDTSMDVDDKYHICTQCKSEFYKWYEGAPNE